MSSFTITFRGGAQDGEERDLGSRSFMDLPLEVPVRGQLYVRDHRADTPGRLVYTYVDRSRAAA